jgi:hypothetical protein
VISEDGLIVCRLEGTRHMLGGNEYGHDEVMVEQSIDSRRFG